MSRSESSTNLVKESLLYLINDFCLLKKTNSKLSEHADEHSIVLPGSVLVCSCSVLGCSVVVLARSCGESLVSPVESEYLIPTDIRLLKNCLLPCLSFKVQLQFLIHRSTFELL